MLIEKKKIEKFQGKMQVLAEVEPNEDNVQLPTETTEEWEAAPGGVFAPVGPDTSPGGKVKKAVLRRVHPYRRRSPKEQSTVAGAPACAGTGAAVEAVGQGTHGARCTVAPPTVQLCSRAPSPRCERHLLHRAAPCTTVQADFPAPSCIGTDGARGLHRILAPAVQ